MRHCVTFEPQAFADYCDSLAWGRFSTLAPIITQAILDIDTPGSGYINSPPARREPDGTWSRKLLGKHRLVYQVSGEEIRILACIHHKK